MVIDITSLKQGLEDTLYFDQDVNMDSTDESIKEIKDLHAKGSINLDIEGNIELNINLEGTLVLEDSISLEDIDYPLSTEIVEKLEKNDENLTNTIDLSEILWQNIVLEVPLRFTKVTDLDEFKGEGWKLLSEDELVKSNNPFEDLKSMFGEE